MVALDFRSARCRTRKSTDSFVEATQIFSYSKKHSLKQTANMGLDRPKSYREGVYYLHVPIQYDATIPDKEHAKTVIGVDINERNVALTALNRDILATNGTLVLDYGPAKGERARRPILVAGAKNATNTPFIARLAIQKSGSSIGYCIESRKRYSNSRMSSMHRRLCSRT